MRDYAVQNQIIAVILRPILGLILFLIAALIARKAIRPLLPEGRLKRWLFRNVSC